MAVEIRGSYLGNLKTELVHGPSGATLVTAAPVDNQGDGSSFSPTDLVAAALGACMVTILAMVARRDELDLGGTHWRVEKHMQADPRRIAALPVEIHLPASLPDAVRPKLERAALACPVHRSLLAEITIEVRFLYDV